MPTDTPTKEPKLVVWPVNSDNPDDIWKELKDYYVKNANITGLKLLDHIKYYYNIKAKTPRELAKQKIV